MHENFNEFGEVEAVQFRCFNPICLRILFISYINICPTCECAGVPAPEWLMEDE